jgi:hypothetical protein
MRVAGAAVRPPLALPRWGISLRTYLLTVAAAALLGLLVAAGAGWLRLLVAGTIALLLLTIMLSRPGVAVLATFTYLVLLAFLRRLLIADAGWSSADPMLLVGPLVAIVAIIRLFVLERRPLVPDLLSKLVLGVLALTFLEVLNPGGGGIAAGIAGLLFIAAPLLWFFVGRELLDDTLIDRLLGLFLLLGTVVAIYGLLQTQVGDPPWDVNWLNVTGGGYSSLNVGGQVRAFGTFASSAEYALSVGSALVIAVAFLLRGRVWALLPVPVLCLALFLSSSRGALVTAFFGVVVLVALRPRRPVAALVVIVLALGTAFGAIHLLGSGAASTSANSLVNHQLGGITEPLNPNSSTLLVHLQLAWDGIKSSLHHPFGQGDAATNGAAGVKANSALTQTQATEVDISNAFVAMGPAGGVLYLITVAVVLFLAVRGFFAGREALLAVIGVLVVALGQWLTGGNYALSPLCWLLAGAVAASSAAALTRPARPSLSGRPVPADR